MWRAGTFFCDKADVIVCDGFTGNVVLKSMEAMYRMIVKRGLNDAFFDRFNYEQYGGTPILGVNATVLIGHGISNDVAIKNMIFAFPRCLPGRCDRTYPFGYGSIHSGWCIFRR